MEKITRGMFEAYEMVRRSGATNMFDVNAVIELCDMYGESLTKQQVLDIMKRYRELKNKYAAN